MRNKVRIDPRDLILETILLEKLEKLEESEVRENDTDKLSQRSDKDSSTVKHLYGLCSPRIY